jgi:hypothetical protein
MFQPKALTFRQRRNLALLADTSEADIAVRKLISLCKQFAED